MSTKPDKQIPDRPASSPADTRDQPGTNAVEHEPDPSADPIPDGKHKYVGGSPFTHGND